MCSQPMLEAIRASEGRSPQHDTLSHSQGDGIQFPSLVTYLLGPRLPRCEAMGARASYDVRVHAKRAR